MTELEHRIALAKVFCERVSTYMIPADDHLMRVIEIIEDGVTCCGTCASYNSLQCDYKVEKCHILMNGCCEWKAAI